MNLLYALLLGVVEGITEFLPVSSTGHLTIVEKLLGLQVNDPGVTAFTAIIQVGAIIASVVYFRADIIRFALAWFRGLRSASARTNADYRLAWYVIIGSIPIGIVGFALRHLVTGPLRSLWVVVIGLLVWSVVMVLAERIGTKQRGEKQLKLVDALTIGIIQCLALAPGVSRSGATISAGLFRGLDRVSATRISFFLAIPALLAAGAFEAGTSAGDISSTVGWLPTLVATVVSFVVGYAAIAWLLRIVARHSIAVFVGYRVAVAVLIGILLATGQVSAT